MELLISRLPNGSHKSTSCIVSSHGRWVGSGGIHAHAHAAFQILTTAILSLLLPLSFLLLARLSTAQYLLSVSDDYPMAQPEPSFLCSIFLYTTRRPTILHLLVSLITVSSLTCTLTTGVSRDDSDSNQRRRPAVLLTRLHLCGAWISLCIVQICVGLGIEGSIAYGIDGSGFGQESSFLGRRMMFFLGLHEAMMFWGRIVVKPVVYDTIFGTYWREAAGSSIIFMAEKVAVGVSYGGLWWWRLREEVESLVMVPELKRELMMRIGAADFMGWWLYYLTVTMGMVRVIKSLIFIALILTRRRRNVQECESELGDDGKV